MHQKEMRKCTPNQHESKVNAAMAGTSSDYPIFLSYSYLIAWFVFTEFGFSLVGVNNTLGST